MAQRAHRSERLTSDCGRSHHRRVALLCAAALAGPTLLAVPVSGVAHALSRLSAPASALSLRDAASAATASGSRVEALGARTENEQTFVNPDGTITLEQTAVPVRVRRGDSWVPVDTTLSVGTDGLVRPAASALSMSFSGGGSAAPLAELAKGGTSLRLSWPATLPALPTPSLAGNAATYAIPRS